MAAGVALLVSFLMFMPSSVSAAPVDDAAETSFSVIGDIQVDVGQEVSTEDLEEVGVPPEVAANLVEGINDVPSTGSKSVSPTLYGPTAPLSAQASFGRVGWTWKDHKNRTVVLRTAINHKIVTKHNASWKVARTTTKYPKTTGVEGSARKYFTPVHNVRCTGYGVFRSCRSIGSVTVKTVVEFMKVRRDGKPRGVITAYCLKHPKCPNYVKNAVNV